MARKELELIIEKVNLKGFKSIEDLSVDLKENLNIIIGKNAAGKSNFLECLFLALSSSTSAKTFKSSKIEFRSSDGNIFVWEAEKEIQGIVKGKESLEDRIGLKERLILNKHKIFDNTAKENPSINYNGRRVPTTRGTAGNILRRLGFPNMPPLYIKFNLPLELDCISTPGTIKINSEDQFQFWGQDIRTLRFVHEIIWRAEFEFENVNESRKSSLNKNAILKLFKIDKGIIENLRKYTPIRDIRFNENINIYKDDNVVIIENLKIDFKLNSEWMPWSQLSDGTKRLFYMISEITNKVSGLILVEEPELGVHPHQFNLIMEFLKEESEYKQIVLSTHSPQALNQLSEKELDHIFIASYEAKKGTKLNPLTKPQIAKAKKYMKEVGFLSDYWMVSDLE